MGGAEAAAGPTVPETVPVGQLTASRRRAAVLVQELGAVPIRADDLHIVTQPCSDARRETRRAHQRSPLRSMRSRSAAVALEDRNVGELVAQHFLQQLRVQAEEGLGSGARVAGSAHSVRGRSAGVG